MKLYRVIEDFCDEYDYAYVDDYSGRGMFGSICVGFKCSNTNRALMELGGFLAVNGATLDDFIDCLRTDMLGRNTIVYFTGITSEDCED